jgi:serine/threonine protein phosphatase PrpC
MSLTVGSCTHVGRVRSGNEDALIAEGGVYVVADGMGGHAAGEIASGIVVETFRELVGRGDIHPEEVRERLEVANRRIRAAVIEDSSRAGMGTTASGVVRVHTGGTAHWAVVNIGDSRVYRAIGSTLRRVTVDHSEVQELQDAGLITAEEARTHPLRNVVTRSLGGHDLPKVDLWVIPPAAGERYLICSDGLTNELTDDHLMDVLSSGDDPQVIADELVERALASGGRDNISVIVLISDAVDGEDVDTAPRAGGARHG